MKGCYLYLIKEEREALVEALLEYQRMKEDDSSVSYGEELRSGLGSALYKLYDGLVGQSMYQKYSKYGKRKGGD